ncbi:MAG: type II toxin-antitoxin system VapC family toxin, partial [Burkholderiales bacterium]
SVWEIALLASKGRIGLGLPVKVWIESALTRPGFVVADLDAGIAIESCCLPGTFHADPSDRFLVATARLTNATIVTRDERILKYGKQGHLKVMAA